MKIRNLFKESYESRMKRAEYEFQITEFNGSLWLTHMGVLICPCSFFKEEPITALQNIRKAFTDVISEKKENEL